MEQSYRFFTNTACRFYPCHEGLDSFNCLFCYCPLYERIPCPGRPEFIKKEDGRIIKKCTGCTFPHRPENYERIMDLLRNSGRKTQAVFSQMEILHGGEQCAGSCIDFSVNVNPLGLPTGVKNALRDAMDDFGNYPDRHCTVLRNEISQCSGVAAGQILCGNGASELICLAVEAIMPQTALLVSPTFSGYERALLARGVKIDYCNLLREEGFAFTQRFFESFCMQLEKNPGIVFLCQPDNPTGCCIPKDMLLLIARRCEEQGTFLVVDECFLGFIPDGERLSMHRELSVFTHVLVIDAATKLYDLPGLRLGWAMSANESLLSRMRILQPEWSVSVAAQLAGTAALKEKEYVAQTRNLISCEHQYLCSSLKKAGCTVYEGTANFLLFTSPVELAAALLEKKISIRSCGNFHQLTQYDYRIAVRTHQENESLINAVKEILRNGR